MSDRLKITCPCCATRLTVDAETGEILTHKRAKRDHSRTLRQALADLDHEAKHRDEAFEKALKRTQHRDDILMKKLREAREQAKEDRSSRPPNPLDRD